MFDLILTQKDIIRRAFFSRAALPIVSLLISNGINSKTLEICRNIYYHALVKRVAKKINSINIGSDYEDPVNSSRCPEQVSTAGSTKKIIWIYWDSGFDNAPLIVKICAKRLKKFDNVKLVFLDNKNLEDYIQLPDHILHKVFEGKISKAHFSDLLRVELLFRYGGVWLDATVFLTGEKIPAELLGNDLFFYSMSKPSINGNPIYLSSWAIASPANHPVLAITRSYLHDYWAKNDKLLDYFLLHITLCATINSFPEYRPKFLGFYNNADPHLLLLNYHSEFSDDLYEAITSVSTIHKLSYKYDEVKGGSVLEHILLH
jgi:hypothetical protein